MGSPVGDVEAAYAGERWRAVCAQLSSSGTALLVFAPAERPWSSALLAPATDVFVLAAAGEEGGAVAAVLFGPTLGRTHTSDTTETPAESPQAGMTGVTATEDAGEAARLATVTPLESHPRFSVALAAYVDPSTAATRLALLR